MVIGEARLITEGHFVHHNSLGHSGQECCFAMNQGIQHTHSSNTQNRFFTGACFDLGHSKTFEPGRRCINIACGDEVRHKIPGDSIGGIGDIFFDSQIGRHFQIGQILQFGARLRPYFADIFPVGRPGIDNSQCLHYFLRAF